MLFQSRFWKYSLLTILSWQLPAQQTGDVKGKFPAAEKLTYRIEWRLINAGTAVLETSQPNASQWQTDLQVESAGLMSRLYKVSDVYKVISDVKFCPVTTSFEAQEGKRHAQTRLIFEGARHKVRYEHRDLIKNSSISSELEVPPCAHEITGALTSLRTLSIEPGKSGTLAVTNGKKAVNARIDAQVRESIVLDGKTYQTIRYEAYIFDNVLYPRKGRLFIWLTDDSERVPVQMRLQMGFPIGNIAIILDKEAKLASATAQR